MGKLSFKVPFKVGYDGGAGQCFCVYDASGARVSAEFRPYSTKADELARILNAGVAALTKPAALPLHTCRALALFMQAYDGISADSFDGIEEHYVTLLQEANGLAHAVMYGQSSALPKEGWLPVEEVIATLECEGEHASEPLSQACLQAADMLNGALSSLPVSREVERLWEALASYRAGRCTKVQFADNVIAALNPQPQEGE